MSRIPKRIPSPNLKAEGSIHLDGVKEPFPYRTQLAGPDGCAIHIWMGKHNQNKGLLYRAYRLADSYRDLIQCTYSTGSPDGFWPNPIDMHEDEYLRP
jgi:hypothetical protein